MLIFNSRGWKIADSFFSVRVASCEKNSTSDRRPLSWTGTQSQVLLRLAKLKHPGYLQKHWSHTWILHSIIILPVIYRSSSSHMLCPPSQEELIKKFDWSERSRAVFSWFYQLCSSKEYFSSLCRRPRAMVWWYWTRSFQAKQSIWSFHLKFGCASDS